MLVGVIVFIVLVLVAAGCNIVSGLVGLGIAPAFPGSHWFFFVKNYLANLVLWMLVVVILSAAVRVWKERRARRQDNGAGLRTRPALRSARIAVALTAYDDEQAIAVSVRDFRSQPGVQTVFAIDNNSRDRTAELAARAGAVVIDEEMQGYGFACIRGLRSGLESGADIIVLSEGDGTFSGADVGKMLPFLEDADMVIGNRVTAGLVDRDSQMDSFFVWGNQLGAKLLQLRFWDPRFLGSIQLSDLGCTYRAIRREALAEIIEELTVGGMHFSPHMIMVSLRRGHTIVEVPVRFYPRVGVSKGARNLRAAFSIGAAMLWHIITFPTNARGGSQPKAATAEERT